MHTIQRIRFQPRPHTTALYFANDSTAMLDATGPHPTYRFEAGQCLSSSSYCNSYYEFPQRRYGLSRQQAFRLSLEGNFEIAVWEAAFNTPPRIVWQETVAGCRPDRPVTATIPAVAQDAPPKRFYFRLRALSAGTFCGGDVATEHEPLPVRLAVVLCTFRREAYLRATVAGLLADPDLKEGLSAVVVVDNGRTLEAGEFADPRVTLLPNRNCGGAGGFSRGMDEVLRRDLGSHILLMDDDIACDSEAVLRTIAFYRHAERPVAVAGAMLDMQKPHLHFEAGALYGRAADSAGENPLKIYGLRRGLSLEQEETLNALLLDERADYGAFWYFAFPARYAAQGGLLLPFFVIGDDIEFGLRLTRRMGVEVAALPGVGVWHQPFYSKISQIKRYFFVRNLLVIDALYNQSGYWRIVRALAADFESDLCKFNYGMVLMLVRAFEDFLQGPPLFTDVDPLALMAGITDEAKDLDDNVRPFLPRETWGFEQPPRESLLRAAVRRLTLGGHLLPRRLLRGAPMQVLLGGVGQWRKNFLCRTAFFLHREAGFANARDIVPARGRRLGWRLLRAFWKGRREWAAARDAWRTQAHELSSSAFWTSYCAPPQKTEEKA